MSRSAYTGVFLRKADAWSSDSALSDAWSGKAPASEGDAAFWSFIVAMLCHVLDHIEYTRVARVTSDTIAASGTLASFDDRLVEWRDLAIGAAMKRLLPSIYDEIDADCRTALGSPLDEALSDFSRAFPSGASQDGVPVSERRKTISGIVRAYLEGQDRP